MLRRPHLELSTVALFSIIMVAACGESADKGGGSYDAVSDVSADVFDSGPGADAARPDVGGDASLDISDATDGSSDTSPNLTTEDYPLARCDSLDKRLCTLPWPSNLYLAPDDSRTTGYQLRFGEESLPAANSGAHIDPDPYRRLDGYGVGTPIMVHFPGVDTSSMPSRYDIEPSIEKDAEIVLLEVQSDGTTERIPYWAELDAHADGSPDKQVLFVRPAVLLEEDTRYIVAFRNLKKKGGGEIQASEAFRALRDDEVEAGSVLAKRQARFEEVFSTLAGAGVSRKSLVLAWDFRTASSDGLHGSMLEMRSDAYQKVGEQGPELDFEAGDVQEYVKSDDGSGKPVDEHIGLEISGTFEVPHYMKKVGDSRSWIFNRDAEGKVVQNGTRQADFLMRVPHAALKGEEVGVILYGHGLLGSREEIKADVWGKVAQQYNYIFIAADWTGMAAGDRSTAVAATADVSNFQGIADRMHQGILEFLLLGRTAKHRVPGLQELTSRGVDVNASEVFYAGGSQGGIYGQTFMALSEEITRGFLAVPGNNYSTMLQRSVNFDQFLQFMKSSYPSPATRAVCVGAMQLLWTGTDPVSYAGHIEQDPLFSGAPDKDVLLTPSKGDYQVAVVTNEVLARSEVGIPLMEDYDDMQTPWNTATASYPRQESGTILFDYGNPWPMRRNRPPKQTGDDPHDNLEQVDKAGELIDTFFRDEKIIDICGMGPCDF